jgi:hypothetical protein
MKVKSRVEIGKKGVTASPGRCLRIGKAVTTLKCGLAYAGNSIRKGDALGISMGLDTVAETVAEAEGLMPKENAIFRSIKAGVLGLAKELKPGKRISKKGATDMLTRVRELGTKVDRLYSEGAKDCV